MITHEAKHAEVKDNEVPTLMALLRGLANLIYLGHNSKGPRVLKQRSHLLYYEVLYHTNSC